jgi:O-antigen/teichoic acid export membrane protein
MLIDQINWNIDIFIIGVYLGPYYVSIYAISTIFNSYYIALSTSISSVFIPRIHMIAESRNNRYEFSSLFIKIGRLQFIVLYFFLSGFFLFGRTFVTLWLGEEFKNAYFITIILLTSVTIPLVQNIGIEIQRSLSLHKFRSVVYLIFALINLGITIPLVIYFNEIGAAIGTAISLLIGNGLIMNIYYYKRIRLDIPLFWSQILKLFPSLFLSILAGVLLNSIITNIDVLSLTLSIFIYTLFFLLFMWNFGLNVFEKSLLSNPLKFFTK